MNTTLQQRCRFYVAVLAACSSLVCHARAQEQKWELAEAIPKFQSNHCVQPSVRERSSFETAASAIELAENDDLSWLDIGAQKFLAQPVLRREGRGYVAVCVPSDVLKRVSTAFETRKGFGKGRIVEYQLELAAKLPNPSNHVIEAVAGSAFNTNIQPSEIFNFQDIRPYARTALASFRTSASKYGQVALEQMSIESSMGTGAAQVAAAVGHPDALPRVEKMMRDALASIPTNRAIPREMRNRLYELSWAIYFAGQSGKKHTGPIHSIMRRQVQSWAPPFGMVDVRPKRLCDVLMRIEGEKSIQAYSFCLDEQVPHEQ